MTEKEAKARQKLSNRIAIIEMQMNWFFGYSQRQANREIFKFNNANYNG